MSGKKSRGRAGGPGTAGGVGFQARVAAALAVAVLAEKDAPPRWGWPQGSTLEAVFAETDEPTDDLHVKSSAGNNAFLQAKANVDLSEKEDSPLASALDQFVRQFRGGGLQPDDRLVLAVGPGSSSRITTDLPHILERVPGAPEGQAIDDLAKGKVEERTLEVVLAHMRRSWNAEAGAAPSDADLKAALVHMRVSVFDLDDDRSDQREAMGLLRGSVLRNPDDAGKAWSELSTYASGLSEKQTGTQRTLLQAELSRQGFELQAARTFRDDIDKLREHSRGTVERLSDLAVVRGDDGNPVKIGRAVPAALQVAAGQGPVVLTGDPGAGKSATLYELASALTGSQDIIVLASDSLSADSLGALRSELNLDHEVLDVLRNWPGTEPGLLIVDALDAARGARTQEALTDLIGRVVAGETRWRPVAAIRRFDLRYSQPLKDLFQSDTPAAPAEYQSPEFGQLSHFNVPLLSDQEIAELEQLAPDLHAAIQAGTDELKELARVPFNLRLLAELVGLDVAKDELEPITTQLQLLNKYWEWRVLRSEAGSDALEAVLRRVLEEMIARHAMRVDRGLLQDDPANGPPLEELLSKQILVEEETGGSARREVLSFAHHVLFDYAVARLLFRGTERTIVDRTLEVPELLLVVRPSYDLHFHYLWQLDDDRATFWSAVLDMAEEEAVPEIGKIVGPGVAAAVLESESDFASLVAALDDEAEGRRRAAEHVLRHLVGARLTDARRGDAIPPERKDAWCDLAVSLSEHVRRETAYPLRSLLMELCENPAVLSDEQRDRAGLAARRLLEWSLTAEPYDRFMVTMAIESVARTASSDVTASTDVLRQVVDPKRLPEHGYQEVPELAREITHLMPIAPDFVRDVYAAAFEFEETSKQSTPMRGGVLALSSHRSQDYGMAHYSLSEAFPAFLKEAPTEAVDALAAVRRAYGKRRGGGAPETLRVDWNGEAVEIEQDGTSVWDVNGLDHDDEVKILNSFQKAVTEDAAADPDAAQRYVELVKGASRPASVWRRLLLCGAENPESFAKQLEPLAASADILSSRDLSGPTGQFLAAAYPHLADAQHVEEAIMGLPDSVSGDGKDAEIAKQRAADARDRLLGCLQAHELQTASAKARLEELRQEGAIPDAEPAAAFTGWRETRDYGDREELAEAGVDVDAEANKKLQNLSEPVSTFSGAHSNAKPSRAEIDAAEGALRSLVDALGEAKAAGAADEQIDRGWGHAATAAATIARAEEVDPEAAPFKLATTVLLESAGHHDPGPREDLESFDDFPSWGSNSPRVEAAAGLPHLAAVAAPDQRVLDSITALSKDEHPAVRLQIARRLSLLRRTAPELMWEIADRMISEDGSLAVLAALTEALPYMTLDDDDKLVEKASHLYGRSQSGEKGSKQLANLCVSLFTDLYVHRGNSAAKQVLDERVLARVGDAPDDTNQILLRLRDAFTQGSDQQTTQDEAVRGRALGAAQSVLDVTVPALETVEEELRKDPDRAEDDPLLERGKGLAQIVDRLSHEIYFATGAFDESKNKPSGISDAQRERLYREGGELLDGLAELPYPTITHHVLESLEVFIPFDPRGVFLRIAQTVKAGRGGGYQLDSLGAALVVRLIERYLAEHRTLLQEDEECRKLLIEVLDLFVQAGWPDARKLTYGLQEIFR